MKTIAELYIKLVLALGQHDASYVDAYYGPPEYKQQEKIPLDEIRKRAQSLLRDLKKRKPAKYDEYARLRHEYLTKQIQSLIFRAEMLGGRKFTFDEESKGLYDAVAPHHPDAYYQAVIDKLGALLPGDGDVASRLQKFRADFVIPKDKLDPVFRAAIAEARKRTLAKIELPANESFTIEYVTGQVWTAYNWYKGDSRSVIQVNTDLPIEIDWAIHLACHEGYPGHHVYNALLERHLMRERGWGEFSIYALFSPQSLIAEGSADYGVSVAFPEEEKLDFMRRVLYPLAGLDASRAALQQQVRALVSELDYAVNDGARRYRDGVASKAETLAWFEKYSLMSKERAEQRLRFIDANGAYVINYNLGQDLVKAYIERRGADRWHEFEKLLSSPRLPSGLK